ncbi:retroelement silencing factor 1 isoform X2 [Saimiri boliviensis]|uniref:retroelement silencing factor 1 isoform X2 n=1 Tax=Saimiri boliviensis TaxID=27679 RepID=UPI000533F06D
MNWNAKPKSTTLPPLYQKSQPPFLQQSLINQVTTTCPSSFSYPGSNQEACMYPSNSNPVSQPLLNIQNYPQQFSVSDMHNGAVVASHTSVERITYANVSGPKQLTQNLQMSSGATQNVWSNSAMRNPVHSPIGATGSHQTDFGTNTPNMPALQSQLVTSDTYSMHMQMIPSNSTRLPVAYQGKQGLNQSFSEQQVDWTQHYMSKGLTYPDYRPPPKLYRYSPESLLQVPAIQKGNLTTSLQGKNSQLPNSVLTLLSKQTAAVPSQQYAMQTDRRPPAPYNCRYGSQPLQSTQCITKHLSMEVPPSGEMHSSEMRTSFQQQWQNPNESLSTVGNFSNLKVSISSKQPFNDPVRSSVDGVQTLAQNNEEKRKDSCNPTSNQVLDTSVTKEKLVRDIKTLLEIKQKFSELARKIKINKDLLMAAGCIKMTDASYSEPAQNSELSLKQTSKIQSAPQITPVPLEKADRQPPTVVKSTETSNTECTLNSDIQKINCRRFNQVNSVVLPNPVYSEKQPMPDQTHDVKDLTSKTSAVEMTQAILSTQLSSEKNVSKVEQNSAVCETISVSKSMSTEKYTSNIENKNALLISLLLQAGKTQKTVFKDASQTIQDSKQDSCEMNPNTQKTDNQLNLKTMETPSISNVSGRTSDNPFCSEQESSTKGTPAKSDSSCSMEVLATCLSLWKKQPSESTKEKQCDKLRTNTTAVGISKPANIHLKSPCSVVGNSISQNKISNPVPQTGLSVVVHNYESSGINTTKGTELQIAVVSPLILSDVKTLSVKGVTPAALPETVYPVIKEGSVCSLQNQLAENAKTAAALKVDVSGPVGSTAVSTKIFPLTEKEKQNDSTNGNSEGTLNVSQGKHDKLEAAIHSPMSDQQTSQESRDSTVVSSDILQIDNICSLVEGDTSYNSQIAKIFSSVSLKVVEPQKPSLPNQQGTGSREPEKQSDDTTENKDSGFQKGQPVQCTDVSQKIHDQPKSEPPLESSFNNLEVNRGILEESNLEHATEENTANDMCSSAAVQEDVYPQETDVSSNYTAQGPARNEIHSDKAPVLYLHDQLSELLKEFPYGIEALNTRDGSVGQQTTYPTSEDQTADKTSCDSKDPGNQIQITMLSSEQMKEIFTEQDDQPCVVDKLEEPEKEKPITEVGSHCDLQAAAGGESRDSVILDSEKDDIHCCALGWLSMIYEGVPQCQCDSIKNSTSEEEKGKDQCSRLETNSCKQGERTSDTAVPVVESKILLNNPKTPPTPDGESHFPEIQYDNDIEDASKTKHKSIPRMEQEVAAGQFSSKCDKLDPLQNHKKKKLRFHEVTFHSSNKMTASYEQASQETQQKKHITQNSRPLKAKTAFLSNKDLCKKHSSLGQSSPEKMKFKPGGFKQKHLEKRKLDQGNILDTEVKRKKHDKQEQNESAGATVKLGESSSNPKERAIVKEKIVSNTKSLDTKSSSSKFRITIPKECLQRQKHKEAVSNKASKIYVKNVPCGSEHMRPSKFVQVGSCGKVNERHSSSVQTSKESLNGLTSHGKSLKIHHSEESKTYNILKNVKEKIHRKSDKIWIDQTKLDKKLTSISSEAEFSQMPLQVKDQKKLYLNRVAFKCTERESICLTRLDSSPRKLHKDKEKRQENKHKAFLPAKDNTDKSKMLEFKLCPDIFLKNAIPVEERKDVKPHPRKEQSPVQDHVNSRHSKRSFSADGFEMLQNPVKDSKALFETYKKMDLEKRSRSLGSSPVK